MIEFGGKNYTYPLVNEEEIWIFKRSLAKEKKTMMEKKMSKPPSLQYVKTGMELSKAYRRTFPEIYKLLDILLTLPVVTATVECSFSQMKIVKTSCLGNRLSDINLARLMRIVTKGPELTSVNFNEILDVIVLHNK